MFGFFRGLKALKALEADPVGFVHSKTPDELASLPDIVRNTALKLTARKAKATGDAQALGAVFALTYHMPYPRDMEQVDLKAAQEFTAIWTKSVQAHALSGRPEKLSAVDLYRDSCALAIRTLRLPQAQLDISFEKCAFSEEEGNQLPSLKSDFDGVADVGVKVVGRMRRHFKVNLRVNEACEIWNDAYAPSSPKAEQIALYAIHEITHVEQMVRLVRNSANIFYDNLMRQSLAMNELKHVFKIYRCGLEERQAYLRASYVSALIRNEPIKPERICLDRHLHEHAKQPLVKEASRILLEMLESGGPLLTASPAARREP